MKNWLTILPWVLCVLMLFYIGQCTHRGESDPEVIKADTVQVITNTVDTVTVNGEGIPYPEPYAVIKHDSVYKDVDTAKIISNYLTENKIKLNINDSIGNLDVFLILQFNQIKSWNWKGTFKTYTKIIDNTITIPSPKRSKLSGGLILTGNDEYFGAAPSLMFTNKKDNTFLIGYDVINKNYSIGAFVKIGRK